MKTKTLIPAALLALSACAFSQRPPGPPPPDIIAVKLDKDHDHKLTAQEIGNAEKSLLKLDEDEDGALSEEELRPEPPRGHRRNRHYDADADINPPPPPPPSELMTTIDTDADGTLSKEELKEASTTLLKLDENSDGKINNSEAPCLGDSDEEDFGPPDGGGGRRPPGPPPGNHPHAGR
jgi:EF hand